MDLFKLGRKPESHKIPVPPDLASWSDEKIAGFIYFWEIRRRGSASSLLNRRNRTTRNRRFVEELMCRVRIYALESGIDIMDSMSQIVDLF